MPKLTLSRLASHVAQAAARLDRAVRDAEQSSAADAVAAAERLSSGTLTAKALRLMGHPYARRAPQNPPDPSVVNARTGLLRREWSKSATATAGGVVRTVVSNAAPYSGYLRGTRTMVSRPIGAAVTAATKTRRAARLRAALRSALSPDPN